LIRGTGILFDCDYLPAWAIKKSAAVKPRSVGF
jgi:hypothetical protein